jgi:hypothetical protein
VVRELYGKYSAFAVGDTLYAHSQSMIFGGGPSSRHENEAAKAPFRKVIPLPEPLYEELREIDDDEMLVTAYWAAKIRGDV